MFRHIVHALETVTLIGGGSVSPFVLNRALALAPQVVAADGGAGVAIEHGLEPLAVIGDLDSLDPETRARLQPDRVYQISEQDSTDFDKALGRIHAPMVLGVGFTGKRMDHYLAVLNSLVRHPAQRCLILGDEDFVFLAPPRLRLDLPQGSVVSLFPMAEVTGRSEGLEWPIDDIAFAPDGRVGTSNRAVGPVRLEFDAPGMLVILPLSALEGTVTALMSAPVWP